MISFRFCSQSKAGKGKNQSREIIIDIENSLFVELESFQWGLTPGFLPYKYFSRNSVSLLFSITIFVKIAMTPFRFCSQSKSGKRKNQSREIIIDIKISLFVELESFQWGLTPGFLPYKYFSRNSVSLLFSITIFVKIAMTPFRFCSQSKSGKRKNQSREIIIYIENSLFVELESFQWGLTPGFLPYKYFSRNSVSLLFSITIFVKIAMTPFRFCSQSKSGKRKNQSREIITDIENSLFVELESFQWRLTPGFLPYKYFSRNSVSLLFSITKFVKISMISFIFCSKNKSGKGKNKSREIITDIENSLFVELESFQLRYIKWFLP
ncbi:hypothetical protein [Okeania sp. KiyG1]|uniref:hypothetical protein n=1 Tax=Okeania sp. KiyG1 TaxID=2720165 RepID=UPI0019250AB6|nr:hypothetical protein [Okeania sp. KiyG1]